MFGFFCEYSVPPNRCEKLLGTSVFKNTKLPYSRDDDDSKGLFVWRNIEHMKFFACQNHFHVADLLLVKEPQVIYGL